MTRMMAACLLLALGACTAPVNVTADEAARNATTPGWTGRTFVIGSTSSVAGSAVATFNQQKWQLGPGR